MEEVTGPALCSARMIGSWIAGMKVHCSRAILIKLSYYLSDRSTEQVAVLVGKRIGDDYVVMDVFRANNEGSDPTDTFFISHNQLSSLGSKAQKGGLRLLGIAHSHLDHHPAVPSQADLAHCFHAVNAVYHPASNSLTWFNGQGEQMQQNVKPSWRIFPYNPAQSSF